VHLIAHDMFNDYRLLNGTIDLRHLLDIGDLVRGGGIDWTRVADKLQGGMLRLALGLYLVNLQKLLRVEVPGTGNGTFVRLLFTRQLARSRLAWFRRANDAAAGPVRWVVRRTRDLRASSRTA
jgi:hypothetical protein